MHVGFDGTIWGGQETGVAVASRRLFLQVASQRDVRWTAFVPRRATSLVASAARIRSVRTVIQPDRSRGMRVLWQQRSLSKLARRHRVDVLYCPCYTAPLRNAPPVVVTVHDLIAWKRPDLCRPLNVLHFRLLVQASVRVARLVTVPTETVKQDLIERLGVPEEKIYVVPWGASLEFDALDGETARRRVQCHYGIDDPFILFAGSVEPKKNLSTLIEAVRRLDAQLILVGPSGWGERSTRRALQRIGPSRCRHLGFVPASRLVELYSGARVVAVPSLIEGFGIPAVEAMACGAPVVAADDPALREVCGGAAIHVPAEDPAALAEGLRRAAEPGDLREDLIRRGHARAAEFTWRRSGDRFLEVLHRAVD